MSSRSSHCILCDIVAGRAEASFVYRDSRVCVFLDIQPINPGHLLVVPIEHAASLEELQEEDSIQLFEVGRQLASALRRSQLRCEGVNLFLADGEAAGQDVFHVHLHVFPRFAGDGFGFTFAPHYTKRPKRAELDRVAGLVRTALEV